MKTILQFFGVVLMVAGLGCFAIWIACKLDDRLRAIEAKQHQAIESKQNSAAPSEVPAVKMLYQWSKDSTNWMDSPLPPYNATMMRIVNVVFVETFAERGQMTNDPWPICLPATIINHGFIPIQKP